MSDRPVKHWTVCVDGLQLANVRSRRAAVKSAVYLRARKFGDVIIWVNHGDGRGWFQEAAFQGRRHA
jgi:hypothetical protein